MKDNHIQNLLDESARLCNNGRQEEAEKLYDKIRKLRGNDAPICFGWDDCSTMMLVQCPWRMDCRE